MTFTTSRLVIVNAFQSHEILILAETREPYIMACRHARDRTFALCYYYL